MLWILEHVPQKIEHTIVMFHGLHALPSDTVFSGEVKFLKFLEISEVGILPKIYIFVTKKSSSKNCQNG